MKNKEPKTSSGRRDFLQAGSMALLGLAMPETLAAAPAATESLAMLGGAKAVSIPAYRIEDLTSWPRYGDKEKEALHRLIDTNKYYEELPLFEKEWQEY